MPMLTMGGARSVGRARRGDPAAPGGADFPNEPVGYVTLTSQPFVSTTAEGWRVDSGTPTLTTDATAPISPSTIVRATYPTGFGSGSAPWAMENLNVSGKTEWYICVTFKHSANFYGQGSATNKMFFVWIGGGPSIFVSAEGVGSGTLTLNGRLQASRDARENLTPNIDSGVVARDTWHKVEVYLKCNTGGAANGTFTMWLNGTKFLEYTDVDFASTFTDFQIPSLYPIWGGGAGEFVPDTMALDFDHFYVSGPA